MISDKKLMEKAAYLWGFRCRQFYKVFVEIVRGLGSNLFQTKNVWQDFKIFVLIVETKFSCCLTKPRPKQSSIILILSSENLSFMNNVKRAESFRWKDIKSNRPSFREKHEVHWLHKTFFWLWKNQSLKSKIWIKIIVFSSLSATYQRSFNLSMKMSKIRILINFLMADWCWCMFSNVNY